VHLSVHVSAFVVCVAIAKWSQGAAPVCPCVRLSQPFIPSAAGAGWESSATAAAIAAAAAAAARASHARHGPYCCLPDLRDAWRERHPGRCVGLSHTTTNVARHKIWLLLTTPTHLQLLQFVLCPPQLALSSSSRHLQLIDAVRQQRLLLATRVKLQAEGADIHNLLVSMCTHFSAFVIVQHCEAGPGLQHYTLCSNAR